ncbi:MAG TPA: hypothetical protein VGE62_00665 [Candidatus Paceibacterota bacterium]
MLTTDKIIAHKTNGKNLILLTRVASSYFLVFGQVIAGRNGGHSYRTIFQKQLSETEAREAYAQIMGLPAHAALPGETSLARTESGQAQQDIHDNATSQIILLENPKQETKPRPAKVFKKPVASPYFPITEILLTRQKPRAPSAVC